MTGNIAEYFRKNIKLFIFILIFCVLVFIYNQNSQTLNFYILKRGTILEYSLKNDADCEKIKNKLSELNIKHYQVDNIDNSEFESYDFEQQKINKILLVGIPILSEKNKENLFNNISQFVFENYPDSKLTDIKSINGNYNEPYAAFLKFLAILFTASILWLILMYLIYDFKTINQAIKTNTLNFFENQKEKLKNLAQKTRENGIGYLLKRILLDEKNDEKESSVTNEIISTIVFVVVCVIVIRFFIGELRWIPSGSMRPTILEKDRVFVEKLDFPTKKTIQRGDILVFYPPATILSNSPIAVFKRLSGIFCKDIAYIKRTIGLPGEKFEIKKDEKSQEYRVFINDEPLNEPYISSKTEWTQCMEGMFCGPFVIPEGHYFMMGDNRNNSQDSRFWGFLDGKRVIGRANFMFWPIKRINVLSDKYLDLYEKKSNGEFKTRKYLLNRYEFL